MKNKHYLLDKRLEHLRKTLKRKIPQEIVVPDDIISRKHFSRMMMY